MRRTRPNFLSAAGGFRFLAAALAFGLALFFGAATGSAAAGRVTVFLKDRVEVDGRRILLEDIARIRSDDRGLVRELGQIDIGPSPRPGETRRIDPASVRNRIQQHRPDPATLNLVAPECIEVTRGAVRVEPETIRQAVTGYLVQRIPYPAERIRVRDILVGEAVVLPRGKVTIRVVRPGNRPRPLIGNVMLAVHFRVDGKVRRKIWVKTRVEVEIDVVIAAVPLGRGQEIGADDVRVERIPMAGLSRTVFTRAEEVVGKQLRRAVAPGTVLGEAMLESPPLVRRGDVVVILAESDGIRITARGKARETGGRGDRIQVANLDSEKSVYGRILDANTVRVDF